MSSTATTKKQDAYRILSLLARGLDPYDASELPDTTCLNRSEVIRALLLATDALATHKGKHVAADYRSAETFTLDEDRRLPKSLYRRSTLQGIDAGHQRSSNVILERVSRLTLVDNHEQA